MKILVVKSALPWPPNQGTKRVSLQLLEALGAAHDVTLVTQYFRRDEAGDVEALARATGVRVVAELAPNRRSPLHRLLWKAGTELQSRLGGHSPRALYATPAPLRRAAATLSADGSIDLALFEYWYTCRVLPVVRARRRVLLAHDAEFQVNRLAAERGGPTRRDAWAATEARREIEALRAVDRVWTLTSEDADALSASAGVERSRFDVMPFGVDTGRLSAPPVTRAAGAPPRILLFGAFVADFNRDAFDWLFDAIAPEIRRVAPGARLVVAGSGLDPDRAARARTAGADVLGAVDDVAALYAEADVVLIPLRFGGGLRIRLLEALAAGRPVVATSVGVGGVEAVSGVHLLTAEEPAGLAAAVGRLLAAPGEATALGRAARELAVRRYSREAAMTGIRQLAASLGDPGTFPGPGA